MKRQRLPSEIVYTFVSLFKGLVVTFTNLLRKKVTLMYPEERWDLPENYRGMPVMPIDRKTGKDKCISCGACMRICPEQIIDVQHEVGEDKKRKLTGFTIDMSRCMFCGLCAEICPTNALVMGEIYEIAHACKERLMFDLDALHELGGFHPEEPEPEAAPESDDPVSGQACPKTTGDTGSGRAPSRPGEGQVSGTGVPETTEPATGGDA